MPCSTDRRQHGFGLLEALVALVLLSSIGFTLLAWVQQNLDGMQRMREFYAVQDARRSLAEWSQRINPMETPEGEADIGSWHARWKSQARGDPVSQMGYPGGIGLYDVALYDVEISLYRPPESKVWLVEKMAVIGFKKVREQRNPFGG